MTKWLVVSTFVLVGCGTDDGGGGGGGDSLPKRGERAEDPTIVSATARCACGDNICETGADPRAYVKVRIDASDPKGASNLGTCAGSIGGVTDQGSFYESNGNCSATLDMQCVPGSTETVDITVSNDTAGFTTASVTLTITE